MYVCMYIKTSSGELWPKKVELTCVHSKSVTTTVRLFYT